MEELSSMKAVPAAKEAGGRCSKGWLFRRSGLLASHTDPLSEHGTPAGYLLPPYPISLSFFGPSHYSELGRFLHTFVNYWSPAGV